MATKQKNVTWTTITPPSEDGSKTETVTAEVSTDFMPIDQVRPGWQTTEFYGTWAVKIFGALMASGIFGDGSTAQRALGAALMILALLGYQGARSLVKANAALILMFLFAGGMLTACVSSAQVKAAPGQAKTAAIDCAKQDAAQIATAVAQLGAGGVTQVLGGAQQPDWDALFASDLALGESIAWCAAVKFVAAFRSTSIAADTGPGAAARAALERLRARIDGPSS